MISVDDDFQKIKLVTTGGLKAFALLCQFPSRIIIVYQYDKESKNITMETSIEYKAYWEKNKNKTKNFGKQVVALLHLVSFKDTKQFSVDEKNVTCPAPLFWVTLTQKHILRVIHWSKNKCFSQYLTDYISAVEQRHIIIIRNPSWFFILKIQNITTCHKCLCNHIYKN